MNVKRHWNLSGGSNDFKVWLKDSIFCAINLVRPHFDRSDCARLGCRTQVNLCHPAGAIYDISDFVADTKTEPPHPHTTCTPINPIDWCLYGMKGKAGEWCQKNETALILWAQLCMQVTAGKSFTRFYLSLPSFLLQVIIGTPPAPTMPGGLLLVDSQTTGSASHPPCSTSLSFSFPPLILSFIHL